MIYDRFNFNITSTEHINTDTHKDTSKSTRKQIDEEPCVCIDYICFVFEYANASV